MITRLAIYGHRSIRDLVLAPGRLTIVTGANGAGKSSLYRALRLLADVAQGRIIQSLALEGGLNSTLWAGPEKFSRAMIAGETPIEPLARQSHKALKLGFASKTYGYAIDLGPSSSATKAFPLDPQIKLEAQWTGEHLDRASLFAERRGPSARIRGQDGEWRQAAASLAGVDSMMTHCADLREAHDLSILRETVRRWRFYDDLRADREAPARRPQIATFTPALADDGADLAGALATILEVGDADGLHETIEDAFPSSMIDISMSDGYAETLMRQHGLLRPLRAAEFSEGTLRYLLLVAALAASAAADGVQRTGIEPASQSDRRAGAPDAQGLESNAAFRRFALGDAAFGTEQGRLLRRNRTGEASGRDACARSRIA